MRPLPEGAYQNKKVSGAETVYELITAEMEPAWGLAIADIGESVLHEHKRTREIYVVVEGSIDLTLDERVIRLEKGDVAEISPGTRHMAKAISAEVARVIVATVPSWTVDDHHTLEHPR